MVFRRKRKNRATQADAASPESKHLAEGEENPMELVDAAMVPEKTMPSSSKRMTRAEKAAAKAERRAAKRQAKLEAKEAAEKEAFSDLDAWRKGAKGRPAQIFIGFLANATKRDAVRYAIGVAERNSMNFASTTYAVFRWNDGWAYEVHEGGPNRAYLPSILKYFDAQGEHARLDELVATIATAHRYVRVERTHTGLTGFLMPETYEGEQTQWLEPGVRLKQAAPVRLGVLAAGGVIFGTGFIALLVSLMLRPDAPVLSAERQVIPYEQLPISLWPTLVRASSEGYVHAMQFSTGGYTFSIQKFGSAEEEVVNVTPPPLPDSE